MSDTTRHFFCPMCDRRYRWSLAVAGKTLRCRCGEPIHVPEDEPPLTAEPISAAVIPSAAAAVRPARSINVSGEAYSTLMSIASHPWRNLIIPIAYFVASLFALGITLNNLCQSAATATGMWILIVGSAALVAGAMLLTGIIRGRHLEITFISFAVASFKILAIILLTDAATFVLTNYWVSIGVFTRHMELGPRLLLTFLAIFAAFFGVMLFAASYLVFNNQDDDFVAVGFPIAVGTWVGHVFIFILAMVGMYIYHRATYIPPPPPPPPPAPVQTGPTPIAPTSGDDQIIARIQRHMLIDGRQYERFHFRNDHGAVALIETMYNAGAANVYIDFHSALKNRYPDRVYVQLPDDPQRQASCQAAATKFLADTQTPPMNVPTGMYKKFLLVPLK